MRVIIVYILNMYCQSNKFKYQITCLFIQDFFKTHVYNKMLGKLFVLFVLFVATNNFFFSRFQFIVQKRELVEFTRILLLSETHWRPIGDQHARSETSTCLMGDLDMPHRRPSCPIRNRHGCGDLTETDMPAESNQNSNTFF